MDKITAGRSKNIPKGMAAAIQIAESIVKMILNFVYMVAPSSVCGALRGTLIYIIYIVSRARA